jgi:hypothetical protein
MRGRKDQEIAERKDLQNNNLHELSKHSKQTVSVLHYTWRRQQYIYIYYNNMQFAAIAVKRTLPRYSQILFFFNS